MKTTAELIARATTELTSVAGYRYNTQVLADTIAAGDLPEGTVFMSCNGIDATFFATEVRFVDADGVVTKTMPVNDDVREAALIVYAKLCAKRATQSGFGC